ncbi:MAG: hypothetical protein IPL06_01940 [Betaproteobacteria bacterium]|nr:hypothetical protein [Betaproteobacteria bacterium]
MPATTDLGFTYRASREGVVRIFRYGKEVTVLRGKAALQFLAKAEGAPPPEVQLLCAKVTGNYKRGNERSGKP